MSLDHWDMRTGRNVRLGNLSAGLSLDHWDMRTGRNLAGVVMVRECESRSLGYAHWPEPVQTVGMFRVQSRSLGYAHWPELRCGAFNYAD